MRPQSLRPAADPERRDGEQQEQGREGDERQVFSHGIPPGPPHGAPGASRLQDQRRPAARGHARGSA